MSKILVIGGTYFAGRVFTIVAAREAHELTLLNRGRYSMARDHVKEVHCDRHDASALAALPLDEEYDAVVDFCAYDPEDVKILFANLPCKFKQYVVLTTADVYKRNGDVRSEASALVETGDQGIVGDYIYKKRLVEKETVECCREAGVSYTILRPAFIYGPYNYAPRENFYFKLIYQNQPLPLPGDANGKFQMVYVKDVALAILKAVGNERAFDQAFNLSAPDVIDYKKFFEILTNITDRPFEVYPCSVAQVEQQHIPVPFPLTPAEDELFDGNKIVRELGLEYSDIEANMKNTFSGLKAVYAPDEV